MGSLSSVLSAVDLFRWPFRWCRRSQADDDHPVVAVPQRLLGGAGALPARPATPPPVAGPGVESLDAYYGVPTTVAPGEINLGGVMAISGIDQQGVRSASLELQLPMRAGGQASLPLAVGGGPVELRSDGGTAVVQMQLGRAGGGTGPLRFTQLQVRFAGGAVIVPKPLDIDGYDWFDGLGNVFADARVSGCHLDAKGELVVDGLVDLPGGTWFDQPLSSWVNLKFKPDTLLSRFLPRRPAAAVGASGGGVPAASGGVPAGAAAAAASAPVPALTPAEVLVALGHLTRPGHFRVRLDVDELGWHSTGAAVDLAQLRGSRSDAALTIEGDIAVDGAGGVDLSELHVRLGDMTLDASQVHVEAARPDGTTTAAVRFSLPEAGRGRFSMRDGSVDIFASPVEHANVTGALQLRAQGERVAAHGELQVALVSPRVPAGFAFIPSACSVTTRGLAMRARMPFDYDAEGRVMRVEGGTLELRTDDVQMRLPMGAPRG